MSEIQFATVLPGAKPFKEGNVNETFRGQILLADGTVKSAIIKDLDQKQLANELFASVLAHAITLPAPIAYLALVRGSDLVVNKAPHLSDGNRLVFASVDVKVPNLTFRINAVSASERQHLFQEIVEWTGLGQLFAFDSWIANIDRHPGNLLFGGKNEIWLIDHGHAFTGPTWQPSDLNSNGEYRNRLSEWITTYLNDSQKNTKSSEVTLCANTISSVDVSTSSRNSRLNDVLDSSEIAAVETFLNNRVNNVTYFANKALGVLI